MPQPEELVRGFLDAWNSGDMDAVGLLLHADVSHTPPPGWPEPGPFLGRHDVMAHFAHLREAFRADTAHAVAEAEIPESGFE